MIWLIINFQYLSINSNIYFLCSSRSSFAPNNHYQCSFGQLQRNEYLKYMLFFEEEPNDFSMQMTHYSVIIFCCCCCWPAPGLSSSFIAAWAAPRLLTLTALALYDDRRSLFFFFRPASSSAVPHKELPSVGPDHSQDA